MRSKVFTAVAVAFLAVTVSAASRPRASVAAPRQFESKHATARPAPGRMDYVFSKTEVFRVDAEGNNTPQLYAYISNIYTSDCGEPRSLENASFLKQVTAFYFDNNGYLAETFTSAFATEQEARDGRAEYVAQLRRHDYTIAFVNDFSYTCGK